MNNEASSQINFAPLSLEELAVRLESAEQRYQKSERRFRILSSILLTGIVGTVLFPLIGTATAQTGGSFNSILTALQTQVNGLQNRVNALDGGTLMASAPTGGWVGSIKDKTQDITRLTDPNTSETTVRLTGVNLQVVSSATTTGGTVDGTGNIIIGFNERRTFNIGDPDPNSRTGSHNLILGYNENYKSYGGIVSGDTNSLELNGASVISSSSSVASGGNSAIIGGIFNSAAQVWSVVVGGQNNSAKRDRSTILGGFFNETEGFLSTVSGGSGNKTTLTGETSSIFGGNGNTASGNRSTALGGTDNIASGFLSVVSGGYLNKSIGERSAISGGASGEAKGFGSSISGGNSNITEGIVSWVGGGQQNYAYGYGNSILGGLNNVTRTNNFAVVCGGQGNIAEGLVSVVGGGAAEIESRPAGWRVSSTLRN